MIMSAVGDKTAMHENHISISARVAESASEIDLTRTRTTTIPKPICDQMM